MNSVSYINSLIIGSAMSDLPIQKSELELALKLIQQENQAAATREFDLSEVVEALTQQMGETIQELERFRYRESFNAHYKNQLNQETEQ